MRARKVQVFFYGSFMSLQKLEKAGIAKRAFAPASLTGFELVINSLATLVDSGDGVVYGILANMTHNELLQLYKEHIATMTDASFLPEAVMVHTRGGKIVPALVYLSTEADTGTPDDGYIDDLVKDAGNYGFPKWYVNHIESFRG